MRQDYYEIIREVGKMNQPAIMYFDKNKKKKPEYYKTYVMACKMAEAAAPHLIKGLFPTELFRSKSPGQTEQEYNYAKDNFRQTTLPIGMDYITTISRCFANLENAITIDDRDLKEYLMYGIKEFNSLTNWITSNLPIIKTLDPNGVISVMPGFKTYVNELNELRISSEMNEPQPVYYESYRIVRFREEEYIIIDTTDYGVKKRNELTYRIIDKLFFYEAKYNIATKEVNVVPYYEHGWGYLPAQKLKGIPRFIDGELVWQSQFYFVTDLLDSILVNSATLQNIIFKCGYPTRVYIGKRCTHSIRSSEGILMTCENGKINNIDTGSYMNCPACNGTGYADRFSELHDYIIQPASSALNEGETKVSVNPFNYVSPDTDIVRFLEDHIAKTEEKARRILHIQSSNSEVKGTENLTATGMVIDNKQMFAFIKPISDQMYDTVQFLFDAIAWMRYKKDFNIKIDKPKDFDFKSERDYMATIKNAYESGAPPFIIHNLIERYANNYYSNSLRAQQITGLIMTTDRLIGMSNADVQIYYLKGQIEDWELHIHQSPFSLIDELLSSDEAALDKPDMKERLIALAKEKAAVSIATPSPEDRINRIINGETRPVNQ